jgi:hypothetical protein
MKKIIITLGLLFLVTVLWAQQDDGARIVTVSEAIQKTVGTTNYTMQVGVPYLGQNINVPERKVNPFDIRFPWDVLYLFPTFTEEDFDVSKGYFGDKILINWDLRANFDIINSIKIYRRAYREYATLQEDKDHLFSFVASVSKSETSYEDEYVEGGALYEYKVVAEGISDTESLYSNYISGIGYRSPTAVVTGNVSYKGGNPVKDVIVRASSDGSSVNEGSSLIVPATSSIKVENINNSITDAATLQAWVKPVTSFTTDVGTPINLFELSDVASNTINVTVNLLAASKTLVVNIGGSEYRLENYFPSGKLNSKGEDIMDPITEFNTSFVHFTVAMSDGNVPSLFINGREITAAYKDDVNTKLVDIDPNYTAPYFNVTKPTQANSLSIGGNPTEWNAIDVGGQKGSYIDEIRVWKALLEPELIRTDYTRYISGNDSRMVSYLTANEKVGSFAYDLSRNGFDYNKNHGKLYEANTPAINKVLWATGTGNFPTSDQLGILGVTDINGNYEITAIPYSGTGESFNITPLFGVHQFEPGQQLVFLGQGSEVVNKVDFLDISSFSFKGKILFDTRGVFKSFVETVKPPETITYKIDYYESSDVDATSEGYNYYQTYSDGKLSKGEYWYNEVTERYEKYATIYSNDVNVYIDGNIVLDANNVPVVSNSEVGGLYGYFDIQVPIGNHFITVKKNGHEFTYGGRFPAESGTFKEFFEDSNEAVIFVDSTRVTVVGKVVGGSVEAAKSIGFGDQGLLEKQVDIDGESETLTISSKNNIGIAEIILGYDPTGKSARFDETEFNFQTNTETGEYRVSVMPLKYEINESNGLRIINNDAISLLEANETLNVSKVPDTIVPVFEYPDGTFETSESYHYEKSFTYRTTPVLRVLEQTSDADVDINGTKISTNGFEFPIYTQFANYQIILKSFERYINKDTGSDVEDIVPIIDGEFKPTNNLALIGTETLERDKNNESIQIYKFKGGMPSISSPFTRTIDLRYRINGVDYEAENYIKKGIVLGGQSDGSQTFLTAAPDIPDIILRDPPGSNSSASINKGESITFNESSGLNVKTGISENFKFLNGVTMGSGGGLAGPKMESKTINDLDIGIGTTISSVDGKDLTKTYNFSQTISTSDSPEYVGAEGDLYIGQSKNYFYGSYDNVQSSIAPIGTSTSFVLTNSNGENVFISKQKAMYFNEEPSETFFVLSQKRILESVIPELELIIYNLDNGIISEDDDGVVDRSYYEQQINLWRKTIYENERSKYRAINDRLAIKNEVDASINSFIFDLELNIDSAETTQLELLSNKLNFSLRLKELIDENFDKNISFDAGVGEITRSVETIVVQEKSTEFNFNVNESFLGAVGYGFNDFGVLFTTKASIDTGISTAFSDEQTSTVNVSYTLKDNDPSNALSIDVINLFDGNGPLFSTIGGTTSCPYEGPELSYFYNHADYDPDTTVFPSLSEDKREQLSYTTQKAENPMISVEIKDVSNVPESRNAEFTLILENLADFNSDAASFNYFELIIDNTTNPYNANINIAQNGRVVYIPYGEPVEYKLTLGKSISDIYDYENIRIVLQSRCDPVNVYSEVFLSAHFVPSCSEVEVTAPLSNWVYNNKTAYNIDESINPLQVKLASFDTSFNSFKKLDLEYRLASSPTWTRLQTYYTNQEFYDEAVEANETEIALIDSPELIYALDVIGLQLSDGDYELRARSTCTNDTEYISDVVTGRVDLTSPQKFGTPLPIDGILGIGEDLKVSYNEPIFFNSAISTIEIKGQTNQLPINHSVSLYFEGATNTAVINSPKITSGDVTLEFWMNNATIAGNTDIIKQESGLNIGLNNGEIFFTLAGVTAQGGIANDGLFHHYTFTHKNSTGEISIYQDDAEIAIIAGNPSLNFTNNNPLIIGGGDFIGNIHDLRLWNKTISLENAYAKMYDKLIGNEANLIGYWPMDEGRGEIAKDLARFKHAIVNADWDIKPKGNSYEFTNGQYLALNNVGFVQLTNEMDATISFWMKTGASQEATLFSNGKGDGSDLVQSNGLTNKWAINISNSGMLSFDSEGNSYVLTSQPINDDTWHHVTILFNRIGSLRTYVDAAPVSSNLMADIGGFSGNKIWLGARGAIDLGDNETVDRTFTGKIDEFRLWNTLRNVEQISRDRFNEVAIESIGLVLYAKMNAPDPENGNAPSYYHADVNETITASLALLNTGAVNYSDDVPTIKPERELIKFEVNHVINEDEMILEPIVTDWASLEGQILDITVHRMFDSANNRQLSPITWTAYVKRNEVSWFAEGYNEIVDIVKNSGKEKSFEITILNKGGNGQPYAINNIPSWLQLSSTSGTIAPDSKIIITATIDKELTAGEYLENLYLQTDFGFDEKLRVKVRVLAPEPDWVVDPTDFDYSMNIIGRIKVDSKFSEDSFDKIAAFYNGEVRGVVNLIYLESFQEYYAYLTVYSNNVYGEAVEFSIWDASQGKILEATIDTSTSTTFKENEVMGSLTNPVIFENSDVLVQAIDLNKGWTWVSLNVNDSKFLDLNALTQGMDLNTDDRILSHSPAQLETYYKDESNSANSTWSGSISANGGLSTSKMYKVNFDFEQSLSSRGIPGDISNWSFSMQENWNWLPYPLLGNQPTNEALAYFDAVDGDVIKSQNLFAIYDPINGWNGTLNYLEAGKGYMIKSSKIQTFNYPSYLGKSESGKSSDITVNESQAKIANEFKSYSGNMNAVVLLPEDYNELFVYDTKGVLKGKATNQIVDNKELSFITIYGDVPEELVFYVGDGRSKKATTKTFNFKNNNVLGTLAKPVILEVFSNNISVFPNPFENSLTVKVDALESQVVTIELYNLTSQLLLSEKFEVVKGVNELIISPNVATGTYLLQVKMKEGTMISKVVKK